MLLTRSRAVVGGRPVASPRPSSSPTHSRHSHTRYDSPPHRPWRRKTIDPINLTFDRVLPSVLPPTCQAPVTDPIVPLSSLECRRCLAWVGRAMVVWAGPWRGCSTRPHGRVPCGAPSDTTSHRCRTPTPGDCSPHLASKERMSSCRPFLTRFSMLSVFVVVRSVGEALEMERAALAERAKQWEQVYTSHHCPSHELMSPMWMIPHFTLRSTHCRLSPSGLAPPPANGLVIPVLPFVYPLHELS